MLIGIVGEKRNVIQKLFAKAKTPALVIDCANAANPHRLKITQEQLTDYHIIPIELLYAFRDITKNLPTQFASIIITPIDILFNYHDNNENMHMYSQAWENLRKHKGTIYVGVNKGTIHENYAKIYCDELIMGHTAYSQRVNLNILQQELRAYMQTMSPEQRAVVEKLLIYPLHHIGSITFASSMHAWALHNISIDVELHRELMMLKEVCEKLEERVDTLERLHGKQDVADRRISEQQFDYTLAQTAIEKHTD
ncbi:MAG TPA: hypothetical protein VK158_02685 [Acidobacteriota bacterium]|nr:hypothetical protein [Acidobacteriota bacterium]